MSFRLSSWYSSGIFTLFVVILILICVIVFKGVFPLIIILSSFVITLLVFCGGCDGPSVALGINPGVCGLGGCSPGACGLSV